MTMRVFIIDDDRDHAESIADVLTMRGFETELAFSGEAGARALPRGAISTSSSWT